MPANGLAEARATGLPPHRALGSAGDQERKPDASVPVPSWASASPTSSFANSGLFQTDFSGAAHASTALSCFIEVISHALSLSIAASILIGRPQRRSGNRRPGPAIMVSTSTLVSPAPLA